MVYRKRKIPLQEPHNIQPEAKRMRKIRMEKIEQKERKRKIDCNEDKVEASKRRCLSIELIHIFILLKKW